MATARELITAFYDNVKRRDMRAARGLLADDMTFIGLFESYPDADSYIATFTELMKIVTDIDVLCIVGEGNNASIFYKMETTDPVPGVTLVAELFEVRADKITRARSAFDGRKFAAMFGDEPAGDGNTAAVRRFEDEFKNQGNLAIVDGLMTDDFVHHLPYPDLPPGRAGMKAVGAFIAGQIRDISTEVKMTVAEGDLVADRMEGRGIRADTEQPISWVENHIYRLRDGRIAELWPAGGPDLSA